MTDFFAGHKKVTLIVLAGLIFLTSFFVRYGLYRVKGFVSTTQFNLIIARNWAQTGLLSYENKDNVVLSSKLVKSDGVPTNLGNKLNFYIYGLLFRYFGFQPNLPMYASFILNSLASVLFFFIIYRIYSLRVGLTAALLSALAPFSLPASNAVGNNEWAVFFLAVAALVFFWPKERKILSLALAGLFLGLSAAVKNSFFIAFLPFVILEFWPAGGLTKRSFLNSVVISLVFLAVVLPLFFIGGNVYLTEMLGATNQYEDSFAVVGHLFPDSYTFHYDRDGFLKDHVASLGHASGGWFQFWGDQGAFLEEFGYKVGFFRAEIITRLYSAWIYFKGLFLSLITFGGLLTWFFMVLGIIELREKKEKPLILFCAYFLATWILFLIFLKTSNFAQLSIISLPVSLLAAVGLDKLARSLSVTVDLWWLSTKKIEAAVIIIFLVVFVQISWWSIRELSLEFESTGSAIRAITAHPISCPAGQLSVIMTGWQANILNYYNNCSFVYFAPSTIKKLAEKEELGQALKIYGIAGYLGYSDEITTIIKKNTVGLKEYKIEGIKL